MGRPQRSFFGVRTWGGWFGNIRWLNSNTTPHRDILTLETVTFWGGIDLGNTPPDTWMPFTETVVLKPAG